MVRRAPKRLRDVQEASNEILSFTRGKTFADYLDDRALRLMVERLFEIIGEAMSQALIDEPDLSDAVPEAHQVIGMRNRIIHGYDVVRHDVVWDSVVNDVPALLARVTDVLHERGWG
jgi:uncharacterized protein with HEPN domain